jgi:hypothetical protein
VVPEGFGARAVQETRGWGQVVRLASWRVSTCSGTRTRPAIQHPHPSPYTRSLPPQPPLTSAPVSTSQIFTVLSCDPLTTRFPSAEIATESTKDECPASVRTCQPAPASLPVRNHTLSETSHPFALANGVSGAGGYKWCVPGVIGFVPGGGRTMH